MSYEIRSDKHWRISKSGYSIKTGFTDSTRIVASYHAPHGKLDARRFEKWLEDAQHACDLHNASIDCADEITQLRAKLDDMTAERNGLRIALNEARSDMAAALSLVADVRAAIGDDGKRMQPELIEYCKAMKRDAERYRWLRERLQVRTEEMMSGAYKPCLNVRIAYSALTHTSSPRDSYLDPARFDAECAKLDAAIDAAMGGWNG